MILLKQPGHKENKFIKFFSQFFPFLLRSFLKLLEVGSPSSLTKGYMILKNANDGGDGGIGIVYQRQVCINGE